MGDLLKRLGYLGLAAALAAALLQALPSPTLRLPADLARNLAVAGVVLVLLGFAAEALGVGHRRCQRCGKPAGSGSVFCAAHQAELGRATREATLQHRRDDRGEW